VGTTLAVMFHRRGFPVVSVISRHLMSARRCARLVNCTQYSTSLKSLAADTSLLVIAVPDEQIRVVVQHLSLQAHLDYRRLEVFHTSGCLTSDELQPLRRRGALTFSLHPIQTFPRALSPELQLKLMKGISYGVEGTRWAIPFAKRLVRELGGNILVVPKKEKIPYHLACVFASNYPVVLLGAVEELVARFARLPRLRHFELLIETSVGNALHHPPQKALTGPIARGNLETVTAHLRTLRRRSSLWAVYRALGLYAVQLSRRAGRLTKKQERALKEILSKA
jgi:predicted short-subunit dehydrogenase-like oxidoreductase (DUF2520 family)